MPEHLGERQVGLRDRDVAEQRLRELVAAARLLGDQLVDLLRPPAVELEPLVDQGDVVGDRLAVAGEHDLGRQLASLSERLEVGDERLRPVAPVRVAVASSGREISGLEEMCLIRWSAAIRIRALRPRRSCPTGCARPVQHLSVRSRSSSISPSRSGRVTLRLRAPAPERGRDGPQRLDDSSGMPFRSMTRACELVVLARVLGKCSTKSTILSIAATSAPEWPR